MTARILRYADLELHLGMNRITIWRRTKNDPTFPQPIRLGNGRTAAVGFLTEEIDNWIAKQSAARISKEQG